MGHDPHCNVQFEHCGLILNPHRTGLWPNCTWKRWPDNSDNSVKMPSLPNRRHASQVGPNLLLNRNTNPTHLRNGAGARRRWRRGQLSTFCKGTEDQSELCGGLLRGGLLWFHRFLIEGFVSWASRKMHKQAKTVLDAAAMQSSKEGAASARAELLEGRISAFGSKASKLPGFRGFSGFGALGARLAWQVVFTGSWGQGELGQRWIPHESMKFCFRSFIASPLTGRSEARAALDETSKAGSTSLERGRNMRAKRSGSAAICKLSLG